MQVAEFFKLCFLLVFSPIIHNITITNNEKYHALLLDNDCRRSKTNFVSENFGIDWLIELKRLVF